MLKFILPIIITMITTTNKMKAFIVLVVFMFNMSLQTNLTQKMAYILMGDQLSFWSTNLVLWVMFIIMFMKTSNKMFHNKIMLTSMLLFMMIFYVWNLMAFFMIFEMSMITMLLIMMSWSYQPERTEAAMFLIIMALMFSLPFMITVMSNSKFLNFWFMETKMSLWNYLSLLLIFMMKMPFYFIHFWLPKVHVEAPIQGSMILAAIMLKLGCYGLIRIMPMMKTFKTMNNSLIMIAMWAMIIMSATCFIQNDIKTLIAYSSIVHMMVIFIIVLINKKKSITASMIIIISHGLCASVLFFLSNMFYKNSKSRSIMLNSGSSFMSPPMTNLWFIACMSNTPMPPAMSMVGELVSFKIMIYWSSMYYMIFAISVLSSLYSIFMFYVMTQSSFSKMVKFTPTTNIKSILISTIHMIPVIFMITKMKMMILL